MCEWPGPADEVEEKYGKIRAIVAPRPVPGDAAGDPPGVGIIFVAFDKIEAAIQVRTRQCAQWSRIIPSRAARGCSTAQFTDSDVNALDDTAHANSFC